MTRAMFVVTQKNGVGLCADNLTAYDGERGRQAIAFISSGRLVTLPVDQVESITLSDHWTHCNGCDGSVAHLSYDSLNEQPKVQA